MGEIVLRAKNVFKSYSNGEDNLHVLKDLSIRGTKRGNCHDYRKIRFWEINFT